MDLSDGYSMKEKVPVIKAFTKTYAMAGLRLGYMIADTEDVLMICPLNDENHIKEVIQQANKI